VRILARNKMKRVGSVSETLARYRLERMDGLDGQGARVRVQARGRESVYVYV